MANWNIIQKIIGISEKTNKEVRTRVEALYHKLIEDNPNISTDELVTQLKSLKKDLLSDTGFVGAGLSESIVDPEAYRRLSYDDLPSDVQLQLRRDGTRGDLRSHEEAEDVYDNDVPSEAKGSVEGVKSITNDPEIDWKHQEAHSNGGSNTHDNGNYGHSSTNTGTETPSQKEIDSDWVDMEVVAEANTPGVTGDLGEVVGETLGCGVGGAGIGAGMGAVNRVVQAKAYRDAGREDLAQAAEAKIAEDAIKGAGRGLKAGVGIAVTQTILGSNPLTAGIGIVAGDSIEYLAKKDQMTEKEKSEKVVSIIGKGALATTLACAGPVGWVGLAGWGVLNAYSSAQQHAEGVKG